MTVRDVMKTLRVSQRTVYRYIKSGRLTATKIGRWYITDRDFKHFLDSNKNNGDFKLNKDI